MRVPLAPANDEVRLLAINEILFKKDDPRTHVFQVECGSVCVYAPHLNAQHAEIEFAFPGDIVGLGFLERHAFTARATTPTRVRTVPVADMEALVANDPKAQSKLADVIEKEFEILRDTFVKSGRDHPQERLAAFLVSLSRENAREGRSAEVIAETMRSDVVAGFLDMSVEELADRLVSLEKTGLIEPTPSHGIRIKDVAALDRFAAGKCRNEPQQGDPPDLR